MHDHAVVLGANIAGLLTARVLADHYAEVTVVERDKLPDGPAARRGVPHGRHLHGLHPRGRQILDELCQFSHVVPLPINAVTACP